LEKARQQWESAVDSLPQFACQLDCDGRVIRANRAVERWKLKVAIDIDHAAGHYLHDVLHPGCDDSGCYLRDLGGQAADTPARDLGADFDVWDAFLKRHLLIRTRRPLLTQQGISSLKEEFIVVTFEDVSEPIKEWVRTEEAIRLTQNELRDLSAQHLIIQEGERRRIAADLHDGLGQTLSLMKLFIEDASRSLREGAAGKAAATLDRLAASAKLALGELRRMSMNLRPATLDDLGIVATLAWYFREFEAASPSIILDRDISVKESEVPDLLKVAIFRIVQEATNNTVKHAGADRIKVSLCNEGDELELLIEDTGSGFDAGTAASRRGFDHGLGLQSMKERAELSGANYEIHSALGEGTSICVRWPSPEAFARMSAAAPMPAKHAAGKPKPIDRQAPDKESDCVA
jgi:signal transduction histidine kinase